MTGEEQQRCLHATNGCWRANHPANRQNGHNGHRAECSDTREQDEMADSGDLADESRCGRSKAGEEEEMAEEV